MKSKAHRLDLLRLAEASPLVAKVFPPDNLEALIFDFRTLCGMASASGPTSFQAAYYQSCLGVLEQYTVYRFRRDLALLFIREGKLYRQEFNNFPDCALAKANLSKPAANNACSNALMTLIFDSEKKRHQMPTGERQALLSALVADHWLPAWDQVLASAENGEIPLDHVKFQLHLYCEKFPSARKRRSAASSHYLPPILVVEPAEKVRAQSRFDAAALRSLEFTLARTPVADRLGELARLHKASPGEFVLEALRRSKKPLRSVTPAAGELLGAIKKVDRTIARRLEEAVTDSVWKGLLDTCESRHRHLSDRREEYLRRRDRKKDRASGGSQ